MVSCGVITVSASPADNVYRNALEVAASKWNLPGSPITFVYTTDFANAAIKVTFAGSSGVCGVSTPGVITIKGTGCGGNVASADQLPALVAHELGHHVGFSSVYHSNYEPTTGHCMSHLPDDLTKFSQSACQFEVDFLASMNSNFGPAVGRDMHILTGLDGPGDPLTIDVGQAVAVGPTGIMLDRVNGSLCPDGVDEGGQVTHPTTWDQCTIIVGLEHWPLVQVVAFGGISASNWNGTTASVTGTARGSASVRFRLNQASGAYYVSPQPVDYTANITVLAPSFEVVGGQGQPGASGAPLSTPIKVRVTDAGTAGVAGRTVTFAPLNGSGSVASTSVVTDAAGYASTTWTLGASGAQSVVATLTGPTVRTVTFTATIVAPTLTACGGNAQSGTAGTTFAISACLTVNGQPIVGAQIGFLPLTGGGTIGPFEVPFYTDATGRATAYWTLGSSLGQQTAKATYTGATGSPANFTATAVAFNPPTGFVRTGCDLELDGNGQTLVSNRFSWTASPDLSWEIGRKTTNDTLSLQIFSSGIGTTWTSGPFLAGGFPKGNSYLFLRGVKPDGNKTAWLALTNNPIQLTSTTGCQW
jgi:hypothetical protein